MRSLQRKEQRPESERERAGERGGRERWEARIRVKNRKKRRSGGRLDICWCRSSPGRSPECTLTSNASSVLILDRLRKVEGRNRRGIFRANQLPFE